MKIYPYVRLIWAAILLAALGGPLVLLDGNIVMVAANLVSLFSAGMIAYALGRLTDESPRFHVAFTHRMISLVLLVLAVICSFLPIAADMLDVFVQLASSMGGIFALLSEFYMFWAFDERVIPCAYVYPARRIRWCFYTPILGAFAAGAIMAAVLLTMPDLQQLTFSAVMLPYVLIDLVLQAIVLVLFGKYLRAVRQREEAPLD